MATGSGPLAANISDAGTSNITPTYAVPNTAPLYEQAGEAFARMSAPFEEALKNRAVDAAKRDAMDATKKLDGAVGGPDAVSRTEAPSHPILDVLTHGAYSAAFHTAALAGLKDDIDNHDELLRGKFQYDPEGYKAASDKALSGFIQGAPESLAVDIEQYGRHKFGDSYATIGRVAQERATAEANRGIGVRVKALDEKLLGLASAGGLDSDQFQRADAERTMLQMERERNPAILYSPEQRGYDDAKLYDDLHGAAAARAAAQSYGDAGGGLPGRAAAYRTLDSELLQGDALKDADPGRRHRIYLDAKKQIDDFSQADIQQQRDQDAEDRAKRAEQRDRVGALRLDVMLGGVSEADIKARSDIPDSDKASLIAGIRAQARHDAAEARAAAAAERAGQAERYREFSDGAHAGTLSDGDIADALHAGLVKPGQARTLAAMRDKSLKPVIDDVMAPVHDQAKRPGRRISNEKLAIAEEAATLYARQHPDADLTMKMKAGEAIAARVFGSKTTPGPGGGGADVARAGQAAKLKTDFAAGRINRAAYNQGMKALVDGH